MNSIRLTRTVTALLIAEVAVFGIQKTIDMYLSGGGSPFTEFFGLVPGYFVGHLYLWQLVTYSFLHGNPMHLFFNGLMLYFIGPQVEAVLGPKRFLKLYFFCVAVAGLFYVVSYPLIQGMSPDDPGMPLVGASGGIFGLLMAFGIFYSENTMMLMIPPVPMKVKHMIWVLAALQFMLIAFSGPGEGLSSVAHLSGMAAGFVFLWFGAWWRSRARTSAHRAQQQRFKKARESSHLKLVVNRDPDTGETPKDDEDGRGPTWH